MSKINKASNKLLFKYFLNRQLSVNNIITGDRCLFNKASFTSVDLYSYNWT